jgi:UDP-glucose 4-epimerase
VSKLVVFGAGGFIGQHLVKKLAENKSNEIIAFDRFSRYKTEAESPFSEHDNVRVIAGDFFNRDDVASVLESVEYVFHFISSTNPASSNNDPFIDIDTNVRSTVTLLELCVEKKVKKVVFPSSGGTVYGDVSEPVITENTVPRPRSPYGIGKLTIEHYLRYFKFTAGLEYVIYRIANPYGPGQNIYGKQGVVPIFMHKFLTREPLTVYGDGSMVRDYFFIDDLISMIVRSYEADNKFDEYNLGSGQGHTVNELIESVEKCAGYSIEKVEVETPASFVHTSVLSIDRYNEEFGNIELTSLEDGIARTWEYVKTLG